METNQNDYFIVKAKENGVQVIGLTRGQDTRFHHTEKLDKGEVMIAQFTDHTSASRSAARRSFSRNTARSTRRNNFSSKAQA